MSKREFTIPLRQSRGTTAIILIALLALGIRLAPLLQSGVDWAMLWADSREYVALARGLRAGCGFAQLHDGACDPPETKRTPGYPIFLTLMPSLRSAVGAQAVLGALVCLMLALLLRRYWNPHAALAAETIVALDIPSISWGAQVLTEQLFQLLLFVAMVSAMIAVLRRKGDAVAFVLAATCGTFAALASFVRPIGEFVLLLIPIPFLLIEGSTRRRCLFLAATTATIPILAVIGWSIRNTRLTGFRGFSTIGVVNLCYYRAVGVRSIVTGASFASEQLRLAQEVQRIEGQARSGPIPAAAVGQIERDAIGTLLRHPIDALAMTAESFLFVAIVPDRSNLDGTFSIEGGGLPAGQAGLNQGSPSWSRVRTRLNTIMRSWKITALVGVQLLITLLVWLGVLLAVRHVKMISASVVWVFFPLVISSSLLLLASGPEATSRMRMPVVPILAMVAAVGWFGGRPVGSSELEEEPQSQTDHRPQNRRVT
jgi:hypothetical protein